MSETEPWICQCRKCHGVHDSADAVQYVWEFSFGEYRSTWDETVRRNQAMLRQDPS
jgi:hypothetical protein